MSEQVKEYRSLSQGMICFAHQISVVLTKKEDLFLPVNYHVSHNRIISDDSAFQIFISSTLSLDGTPDDGSFQMNMGVSAGDCCFYELPGFFSSTSLQSECRRIRFFGSKEFHRISIIDFIT